MSIALASAIDDALFLFSGFLRENERWRIDRPAFLNYDRRPGDGHTHGCWVSLFSAEDDEDTLQLGQMVLSFLDTRTGDWADEVGSPAAIGTRRRLRSRRRFHSEGENLAGRT